MLGRGQSLIVALLAVARHRPDGEPSGKSAALPPDSPDAIPEGPLGGQLRGHEFTHQVGTYLIDRRPGHEHFDIQLSEAGSDDPCDRRRRAHGSSVWIRRRGADAIEAATVRLLPGAESDWEVHYQVRAHDEWAGSGDASALLVVHDPDPDLVVRGELWACFADGRESCVSGSFAAKHCTLSIDAPIRGTELMERPPEAGSVAADVPSETEPAASSSAAPAGSQAAARGAPP
jgi:hypothetical protein